MFSDGIAERVTRPGMTEYKKGQLINMSDNTNPMSTSEIRFSEMTDN